MVCPVLWQLTGSANALSKKTTNWVSRGIARIGVHTGSAIVGNFSGDNHFHYTAHGDAVNTTTRLETANKSLGTRICVNDHTADAGPDQLTAYLDAFEMRLRGDPMCLRAFASYVGARDNDPLAKYHLQRLLGASIGFYS